MYIFLSNICNKQFVHTSHWGYIWQYAVLLSYWQSFWQYLFITPTAPLTVLYIFFMSFTMQYYIEAGNTHHTKNNIFASTFSISTIGKWKYPDNALGFINHSTKSEIWFCIWMHNVRYYMLIIPYCWFPVTAHWGIENIVNIFKTIVIRAAMLQQGTNFVFWFEIPECLGRLLYLNP